MMAQRAGQSGQNGRVTEWEWVFVNGERRRLRRGFTTGACAAAATKGALSALIRQEPVQHTQICLPVGTRVSFELAELHFDRETARAAVIKDGGDDPDATHGAKIFATVSWKKEPGLVIDGGEGVGRVTKPGLAVPVGEAAINPVPRKMIRQAVEELVDLSHCGVQVVISVPGGAEIAKKTLNGRLGIVGGISILGTTGIVRPYSSSAYIASVVQAIHVAVANGCQELVFSTGGRTEKCAMRLYPRLPMEAFIEMADYLKQAVAAVARQEAVKRMNLVGMIGKLSKAAAGHLELHSRDTRVDLHFLARLAAQTGAPATVVHQVALANTARQVEELMKRCGNDRFFAHLCRFVADNIRRQVARSLEVEVTLVDLNGETLGRHWQR